jgi:hypothetical protein
MRRALVSPLLSLVMPGVGQMVNRQPGKGVILVAAATVIFLVAMGMFLYKLNRAVVDLGELPPGADPMRALHQAMWAQGVTWLWVLGGLYLALLAYAMWDAWRHGRAWDRREGL